MISNETTTTLSSSRPNEKNSRIIVCIRTTYSTSCKNVPVICRDAMIIAHMQVSHQKGSVHFILVVAVLTGVTLLLFAGTLLKPVWEHEGVREPLEAAKEEIQEQASSALSFAELAPQ